MAHLERALRCATCAWRTRSWSSARTPTPTTAARPSTIVAAGRLRAVDAPQPRAHDPDGRGPRGRARAAPGGRPPERRPRGAAAPLRRRARRARDPGIAGPVEPDRDLLDGVDVSTDLGEWVGLRDARPRPLARLPVPARAAPADLRRPPARAHLAVLRVRLLADPVGEFLHSLDVVERLGARLCLAGHGRTFTDVHAHIQGNRALVEEHLDEVLQALGARGADAPSRSSAPSTATRSPSRTASGCSRRCSAT